MIKIAILGGGNIGTLLSAELSDKADVTVYSSHFDKWAERIEIYNSRDELLGVGKKIKVTNNLKQCIEGAKYIFLAIPAFLFVKIAKQLENLVEVNQIICVIPGCGAEYAFKKLIDKGVGFIGFQRVHCIARIKEYGSSVYALGRKQRIELASIPSTLAECLRDEIAQLFSMPCINLANYLCLTLTPSNPILHTSRLYSLFQNYKDGVKYSAIPLFYEEWDKSASYYLLKMDKELQSLCDVIPLDLHEVVSLKIYYESETEDKMTEKIRSIVAFKGIQTPMKQCADGEYVPDFSSRYFTADFDYGLKIICDIANLFEVKAECMHFVYNWYRKVTGDDRDAFELPNNKNEFLQLYGVTKY